MLLDRTEFELSGDARKELEEIKNELLRQRTKFETWIAKVENPTREITKCLNAGFVKLDEATVEVGYGLDSTRMKVFTVLKDPHTPD